MARWSSMTSRAAIMLACLVLVPLAALFGTSLPESLRAKLAGPAPRRTDDGAKPRTNHAATEAQGKPKQGTGTEPAGPRNENLTGQPTSGVEGKFPTARLGEPASGAHSHGSVPAQTLSPPSQPQPDPHGKSSPAAPSVPPAAPFVPEDRLHGLLLRLQDLGADHYRLERSPTAGGQFWFTCTIHGIRQPFQSADPDPLRAVEHVARAVESWRNAVR